MKLHVTFKYAFIITELQIVSHKHLGPLSNTVPVFRGNNVFIHIKMTTTLPLTLVRAAKNNQRGHKHCKHSNVHFVGWLTWERTGRTFKHCCYCWVIILWDMCQGWQPDSGYLCCGRSTVFPLQAANVPRTKSITIPPQTHISGSLTHNASPAAQMVWKARWIVNDIRK